MSERIQKLLATAGVGSRREVERMIETGRITVNGEVATLGGKAHWGDAIALDGKALRLEQRSETLQRVLIYHKPEGEVCTRSDPEGRPTIFAKLPPIRAGRWIAVGRLDINTSGVILMTTDGDLANLLMHPSSEIEREYATRVLGDVDNELLQRLTQGVELEDGMARFNTITDAGGQGANHWYHVTLNEGRNREVRRLWESQGVKVSRLIRVRFGFITLRRGLKAGAWDELNRDAMNELRQLVGMPKIAEVASTRGSRDTPENKGARRPFADKSPRRSDGDRAAPRSDNARPPRRAEGDKPARRPEGDRSPRRSDGDRAAPRSDSARPPRRAEGDKPARRPEGDRSPRRSDGDRAAPRSDRAAPRSDNARPPRRAEGDKPARRPEGDRSPRRSDGDKAVPRSDRAAPRSDSAKPPRRAEGDKPSRRPDGDKSARPPTARQPKRRQTRK